VTPDRTHPVLLPLGEPMRYLLAAVLLAFLSAIVVFALQNTESVTVRFLNWSVTLPFALLAIIIYLAGMLSGWGVVSFVRRSIRRVRAE
jgi:putative membrane protein